MGPHTWYEGLLDCLGKVWLLAPVIGWIVGSNRLDHHAFGAGGSMTSGG
jgi:hypothetical protein